MKLIKGMLCLLVLLTVGTQTSFCNNTNVNTIELFKSLTNQKYVLSSQYGNKEDLPDNAKFCMDEMLKRSNSSAYYGLKIKAKDNIYDTYSEQSRYADELKESVNYAESTLLLLKKTGFLKELKNKKLNAALMFDIDNTLAFASEYDDDDTGNCPEIKETSDFVRKYCFKDGLKCYFITARICSSQEYSSTYKWLKDKFNLSDSVLKNNLYLTGNIKGCESSKFEKVAYKDMVKHALSKKHNLFWIMSIGDQLTDVFGENSGIKILLPNKFFKSDITPHTDKKQNCGFTTVVQPSNECINKFEPTILDKTNQEYCRNCKDPNGC